jgi:signal transduction histidine kinase
LRDNISLMLPHELRTPLNGILAYGEILAADAAKLKPAEIAEMGQVVHQSGKRLERLIENFLIYAQLELIAADPKNVNALRLGRTRIGAYIQFAENAGAAGAGPRPGHPPWNLHGGKLLQQHQRQFHPPWNNRREIHPARPQRNFFNGATVVCRRVHVFPERILPK